MQLSRGLFLFAAAFLAGSCVSSRPTGGSDRSPPRTIPEMTGYRETSRYADVRAFLSSMQKISASLALSSIGRTSEGREIPYVIASRPLVTTPAAAKALGRPIVYVQANIHGGEVEGKDALLALVRDLVLSPNPNVLDSLVLIAVPIYNADGNERFGPEAENRTEQNGPASVGRRANGMNLDLNRDYVKAEAPETRASLAMFNTWDPDVFVDLHTTNGSFHGYALTYSPSLSPAAVFGGVYARDSLLPVLRERMRVRHGFATFDYGNFISDDTVSRGWATYDARPRFGTNYYGIRGRIGILSEAYSHDPLEKRIKSTYAFVAELLSLTAERAGTIRSLTNRASAQPLAWGRATDSAQMIPIRSELIPSGVKGPVLAEEMESTGDTTVSEPGLPRGKRRTGRFKAVEMPIFDRFVPTLERLPPAAYVLGPADTAAVRVLRLHGIVVERSDTAWAATRGESFALDSVINATRPFQGHRETRLKGRWERAPEIIQAGSWIVSTAQPLGALVVYLLEPESDDGLTAWNFFDRGLRRGGKFPVRRILDLSRRGRVNTRRSTAAAL
ncbi:MAG TPA: M14 family metallopeptidase [Gemmatimonadaceae bacterium]|nr:M14 family metallopeptidase [Gemmatimonadaceae bacterium]